MNLFVSFLPARYDSWVQSAQNDPIAGRKLTETRESTNRVVESWASSLGGAKADDSWGITVEISAAGLDSLEDVKNTYASGWDDQVGVGVGKNMSEAQGALEISLVSGKTTFYGPEVVVQRLEKAQGSAQFHRRSHSVRIPHHLHSGIQGHDASPPPVSHSAQKSSPHPREASFHAVAQKQAKKDNHEKLQNSDYLQNLRDQTATALENLRGQLPVLEQVKTAYPEAYQAVLGLVQNVIALAREIDSTDKPGEDVPD